MNFTYFLSETLQNPNICKQTCYYFFKNGVHYKTHWNMEINQGNILRSQCHDVCVCVCVFYVF